MGEQWIIESVSEDGRRFRPSDWIERVSAMLATFGRDQRLRYDGEVHPCIIQGEKCLVVSKGLERRAPQLLQYIMEFAATNHLRIQEDRRSFNLPNAVERRAPPSQSGDGTKTKEGGM